MIRKETQLLVVTDFKRRRVKEVYKQTRIILYLPFTRLQVTIYVGKARVA